MQYPEITYPGFNFLDWLRQVCNRILCLGIGRIGAEQGVVAGYPVNDDFYIGCILF